MKWIVQIKIEARDPLLTRKLRELGELASRPGQRYGARTVVGSDLNTIDACQQRLYGITCCHHGNHAAKAANPFLIDTSKIDDRHSRRQVQSAARFCGSHFSNAVAQNCLRSKPRFPQQSRWR